MRDIRNYISEMDGLKIEPGGLSLRHKQEWKTAPCALVSIGAAGLGA